MDHSTALSPAAYAVIIGIDRYRDARIPPLQFARKDARAFYRALGDPQTWGIPPEHITLLLNEEASRESIRSAIAAQLRRRAGMVYIYFAGHGAPALNLSSRSGRPAIEKYLLPADVNADDFPASAISLGEIKEFLEWRQAEQAVLLLDTSFSPGEGGRSFRNPRFPASIELTDRELEMLAGEGTAVLAACQAGEVALELAQVGHGLFTYFLLEGVKGQVVQQAEPRILLDDLYEYVFANVQYHARKFGREMQPRCAGSLQGDIFLRKHLLPAAPAEEERLRLRVQQLYALAKRAHQQGDEEAVYRILQNVLDIFPADEKARKVVAALEKKRRTAGQPPAVSETPAPAPPVPSSTVKETVIPQTPRPAPREVKTPPGPAVPLEKKAPPAAKAALKKPAKPPRQKPRGWIFTLLAALALAAVMLMVYAPGLNRSEPLLLFNSLDRNVRPFRSAPAQLSPGKVREMLRQHDFYERHWNEAAPGFANRFETVGDGLALDFASLLMWQRRGSPQPLTFKQAQDYIRQLNQDKFAGYSDWRLPTLEEAMSLVERNTANRDLNIDNVFDPLQRVIWTADDESAARKWSVSFYDGYCFPNDVRFRSFYVRAVR